MQRGPYLPAAKSQRKGPSDFIHNLFNEAGEAILFRRAYAGGFDSGNQTLTVVPTPTSLSISKWPR